MSDDVHPDLRRRLDAIRAAMGPDATDADAVEYAVDWLSDHLGGGRLVLSAQTIQRLVELLPVVTLWAESQGQSQTGLGDVVELSIAVMHGMTFERARQMIEDGEVKPRAALH